MIKKIEIALGIILAVLIIAIVITMSRNSEDRIMPQDVVYDFFSMMYEGDFEEAFNTYLDETKEAQIDALLSQETLYKQHWARYGVDIVSEEYNDREGTATVGVVIHKLNCEKILMDVKLKLLNVNPLKEDGTLITEEELNILKDEYIMNAFKEGSNKYDVITNEYDLKLVATEDGESWLIVNDSNISDILFGNKSNVSESNESELNELEDAEDVKGSIEA